MRLSQSTLCGSVLLFSSACSDTNQNHAFNLDQKYFEVALGLSTGKGARTGSGEGLGLLSGKDVRIKYSILGCKSGFKKSVTEFVSVADLSLKFYRGDSGCTVRLDSIRLQASGKSEFSDYAIGVGSPDSSFAVAGPSPATQAKIYKSSSNPNQMLLIKDIPFDMKTNTHLDFIFQSVSGDVTTKAIANVVMSQPLGTAALEAPNFEIPFDAKSPDSPNRGLSLSSQGAVYSGGSAGSAEANGGLQIDVLMRCANNMSLGTAGAVNTTANCPTPAGDAMKVHDLQLAVVMCRSKNDLLTYSEAAALFFATPSSRVMQAPSSLVPVIKSGVNFSSQATSDFITGLRFKGVKTHFPSAAIAGTAIDKGCVFDQASQAKGWMILRKTEGSGSSQVSSYQVTNIELSASTSVAAIGAAMNEEGKPSGSSAQSSSNNGNSAPTPLGGFYSATIMSAHSGAGSAGSYSGFTSGDGSGGANGFRFSAPDASINYYSELRIDNSNWNNSHGFVGVVDETHWSNSPHWGGSTGSRLMYYLGNNFSYGTGTGSVQDPSTDYPSGTFAIGDILGLVVHQKQGIVKYYKNGKRFATISNSGAANKKLFIAVFDWYFKKSLAATMLTTPSQYASSYSYDAPFDTSNTNTNINTNTTTAAMLTGFHAAPILSAYSGAGTVGSYSGFTNGDAKGAQNGFRFSAPAAMQNYYSELRIDNSNWTNSRGFVGVVDESHWNVLGWTVSTGVRMMFYLGNNFSFGEQTGSAQSSSNYSSGTFVKDDILGIVVNQQSGNVKFYKNGSYIASISNSKAASTKLYIAVSDWYYGQALAATMLTTPSAYAKNYSY